MKFNFVLFLLLLYAQNLFSQVGELEINQLTGDFYIYTTFKELNEKPFPSNGMYLVTSEGAVVFDTPWDTTQFQALVDSISLKHNTNITLCISTHYHNDRTAGLNFFKSIGARTFSSQQTKQLCKINNEKQAEFTFSKDTIFKIGAYSFRTFYPGEGHTADNQVILFDKEKIIYGGCLIKSVESANMGWVGDGNLQEWPRSLNRLKKQMRRPKFIIPGHQNWKNRKAIRHTLKLLKKLKKCNNGSP